MDEQPKSTAEKILPGGLLNTIRRWSLLIELVHDVAFMRYYQKSFFKYREHKYLQSSKEYEAKVDKLLDLLWPDHDQQTKLF